MQSHQEPGGMQRLASAGGGLIYFCRSLGLTVEVFLRSRFGERHIHLQFLGAVASIWAAGLFWPHYNLVGLVVFFWCFVAMCLGARLGIFFRRWRGDGVHSAYTGLPHLLRLFPALNERAVKLLIEPALVLIAGFAIGFVNAPLGGFLMTASLGLAISTGLDAARDRAALRHLRDSYIEQRVHAERFRAEPLDSERRF